MGKKLWIPLALLLLFLGGCQKEKAPEISEGAAKTIEAMTTCPDPDLFDLKMGAFIDLEGKQDPVQKETAEKASEVVFANWENRLGTYYAPGCLRGFLLNSGMRYQVMAGVEGSKIALESMTLEKKTDSYEIVLVELTVDDVPETLRLSFSYDSDDLISRIDYLPQKES